VATILRYVRANGRVAFTEWLSSLRNPVLQANILTRLNQAASGNFGDFASVGRGVLEGMEREAGMTAFPRDVPHHECTVKELKADRDLALEYFKLSVQALGNKSEAAGGLLGLATLQEAFASLKALAAQAGTPVFDTAAEYRNWSLQHR